MFGLLTSLTRHQAFRLAAKGGTCLLGLTIGASVGAFCTGWVHAPPASGVRHLSSPAGQQAGAAASAAASSRRAVPAAAAERRTPPPLQRTF
jgi:hypothetical protein